jgi:hypothetical protein
MLSVCYMERNVVLLADEEAGLCAYSKHSLRKHKTRVHPSPFDSRYQVLSTNYGSIFTVFYLHSEQH